jgi:predicted Zn-dependent protease
MTISPLAAVVACVVPLTYQTQRPDARFGGQAQARHVQATLAQATRTQATHAHAPQAPLQSPQPTAALEAREQQAKQAMADGRYDDAAQGYRELLRAVPKEPGLLMNLGMALAMGGHSHDAIDPLTMATTLRPTLLPAWLFLGSAYLDLGQADKAIPPLRRFVTAQPAHVESRQMLATALLVSGRAREALAHFLRLTKLVPGDAKTWVGVVQCYDALTQEAVEHLRQALTPNAEAYQQLVLADALEADEKNEQAFALYRSAQQALPRFGAINDAIAQIYEKTGHPEWAAAERAKAGRGGGSGGAGGGRSAGGAGGAGRAGGAGGAGASGSTLDCATHKAECEFRAHRYAGVITAVAARTDLESQYWRARAYAELGLEAFAHLAELPASQELHELKAELFRNEGRHLQSVEELKAALTFARDDPRLQKELAKSYLLSRDADHARPLLQTLVTRQPDDPEVPLLYGEILLEAQQVEEALPYLKTAAARDPASVNVHAALGRALAQLGQPAEAIPHLKAALSQDEDGSLRYQLARAYQATGQPDLAKPLLEEYQTMQRAAQARTQSATAEAKITPP